MAAPATQRIGTRFGTKGRYWAAGFHTGVDFLTPTGTTLRAPADSKIIFAGRGGWGAAYGIHVIGECKGTDGKTYRWITAHMSSEVVPAGQQVKLGQTLGRSGATGNVTGPHCHFEVRAYNRSARDGVFGYWDHVNPAVVLNVTATAPSKPSTNKMDPAAYFTGAKGAHITWLGERLVAHGFGKHYTTGPGPSWGEADRLNVRAFQFAQGWTGDSADGFPGALTLTKLAAAVPVAPVPEVPVEIIPRSMWTSEPNGREDRPLDVAKVTGFTIHYPADGDVTYSEYTQAQVASLLAAYRRHHVDGNDWVDIGYNYAIDQRGRVWFLTGDTVGAHAGEAGNPATIGVLFIVGDTEEPSAVAVEAFRQLRAAKLTRFPKATKVQGHRQVPGNLTSCPGGPLMALIADGQFVKAPLKTTPPKPVQVPPAQFGQRVMVLNVNKNRITPTGTNKDSVGAFTDVKKGRGYSDRLPLLAAKVKRVRASLVLTQEAGKYADGDAFAAELGPQFKSILHGDGRGDLTNAIVPDIKKRRIVAEGSFTTSSSPNHHNVATWVVLEDIGTGIRVVVGDTHEEYRAGGTTKAGNQYDKTREAQTKKFLTELVKIGKQFGTNRVLAGGDYNSDAEQPYDGPGRAAKALGFQDAEKVSPVRFNEKYGTTFDVDGVDPRISGRHIDRVFVLNLKITEWGIDIVLNSAGKLTKPHATDHHGVWIECTATK